MSLFHKANVDSARKLRELMIKKKELRPSEEEVFNHIRRMGLKPTKENAETIFAAFILGMLSCEPEDSELLNDLGING